MPKPKICVISTSPLIVHFFLKPHLRALAETCDVTLAINPDNDPYTPPLALPLRQEPIGIKRQIAPWQDFKTLIQLWHLFCREHYNVVWAVAPKAGLLGMIAARVSCVPRRVFIFQGEVWASRKGFGRWVLKLTDRITAACATHIIAVSRSEKDFLEAEGVVARNRIQVLGEGSIGGVDCARFRSDPAARADIRAALGIPAEATLALFMGRFTADKGIFDLAQAFAQAAAARPHLWLLLVGPDEEKVTPKLHQLLGSVAERTRFTGFTDTPERYMAAADFLCLPSYREGFGMVILEAAAAGIPSIGSRIYGISDAIVENETGLLFDVGHAEKLCNAIAQLADNADLRMRLGQAARARANEDFEQSKIVGLYVDLLRNLAENGRCRE